MDFAYALELVPLLARGAAVSFAVTACSFVAAALIAVLLMAMRISRNILISMPARAYIDFMRSTPLLVHIYALFFVLPEYGIRLSPFWTGILAIALHNAAYIAEIYRSSWEAIPRGQWEGARSLSLSPFRTLKSVIFPQMLPRLVPDVGNFLIYSFKDSPLLGTIAVAEIMYAANDLASANFRYLEPITMVGLFFLAISVAVASAIKGVDARVGALWRNARR